MSNYGKRPELAWLRVEKLYVDHLYQRTLESRRSIHLVNKLVAAFDWSRCGSILVTKTDRGYAILDGQHRVEAARKLGDISEMPCCIIDAGSTAEQARAFVAANLDRVAVNPFALHHALVAAGDGAALEIARVCAEAGVTIPRSPIPTNKMKVGQTLALASIGKAIKAKGAEYALAALKVMMESVGDAPGRLRAHLFTATVNLLHDGLPPARLVRILKNRSESDLDNAIYLLGLENKGSQSAAAYAVIKAWTEGRPVAGALRAPPALRVPTMEDWEASETLPEGVRRRCDSCNRMFSPKTVGETNCGCKRGVSAA